MFVKALISATALAQAALAVKLETSAECIYVVRDREVADEEVIEGVDLITLEPKG